MSSLQAEECLNYVQRSDRATGCRPDPANYVRVRWLLGCRASCGDDAAFKQTDSGRRHRRRHGLLSICLPATTSNSLSERQPRDHHHDDQRRITDGLLVRQLLLLLCCCRRAAQWAAVGLQSERASTPIWALQSIPDERSRRTVGIADAQADRLGVLVHPSAPPVPHLPLPVPGAPPSSLPARGAVVATHPRARRFPAATRIAPRIGRKTLI